jgi:glutamine synthetase
MGDHMWMARYILARVAEKHGVVISYDPKPVIGDWNGSGGHTNYSTKAICEDGGYKVILEACEKLGKHIKEHMDTYGSGNERRLTGKHETQAMDKFSYGVADRGSSIRIPRQTELDGKGYLEDRRPAANVDLHRHWSHLQEHHQLTALVLF